MADPVFEAAAVDSPPPALRWVLCALVLFFAPDAAAWTTPAKEEVRDEIWAATTRRLELLDELKALGEPGVAAAPRPSGSKRQASPEVARRQAPPAPHDPGPPPNEAIDVSLTRTTVSDGPILLLEQRVDADGDGLYEEIHWAEEDGGREVFRKHIDRNRDGRIDCWRKIRRGRIAAQILDTDFNGRPDVWEHYGAERTVSRQVDRDQDGVRDAFFYYQGDRLAMDAEDMDGDGSIDVRSFYEEGQLVRREVLNPELFF
jgi:hypothetical protein